MRLGAAAQSHRMLLGSDQQMADPGLLRKN